jgi:uncharacterized protein YkwD
MERLRRAAAALLVAATTTTGCVVIEQEVPSQATGPPSQPPPETGESAPPEQRMARDIFDRVNAEREARGVQPVTWNEDLAAIARSWSEEMASRGQLEHQDVREILQGDELSGFTSVGENVFESTGPVPAGAIHAGWMRSDSHRGNVVNPGWNRLGVGVVCADDGSVWATQEFGRTVDADLPPVSQETPPQEPIVRPEAEGPSCA